MSAKYLWRILEGIFLLLTFSHAAAYQPQEILVIPWGDADNQLQIKAGDVDPAALPETVFTVYPAGPEIGFVDCHDNVYLASMNLNYLKGYHKDGALFASLISTHPTYYDYDYDEIENVTAETSSSIYKQLVSEGKYPIETFMNFYVDSVYNIYVEELNNAEGLPVVDTLGRLLRLLNPAGAYAAYSGSDMKWHSNDVLTLFDNDYYEYATYRNGKFFEGGLGDGWLAGDHYYYSALLYGKGDSALYFSRTPDPTWTDFYRDNLLEADTIFEYYCPLSGDWNFADLLGVDDAMKIFVSLRNIGAKSQRINVYDMNFRLIDWFDVPDAAANKYGWVIYDPFFRPSDGSLFEFRCLDDGLHVIKWSGASRQ